MVCEIFEMDMFIVVNIICHKLKVWWIVKDLTLGYENKGSIVSWKHLYFLIYVIT